MTSLELYTKGAKVWIPHPQNVWEGAELIENYSPSRTTLLVQTDENKERRTLNIKSESNLPHLRNPPILVGAQDLTSLSYLHEPAVLYNLNVRFCQQRDIYTYCGIVLVAINPYSDLLIYDNDTIQAYRGQAMGDLDPHIFAVAEEAYTKLEREQKDQSIIVSGESGAGKTVSAKYAMRYFATVGGSSTETQVEKKVLASSPIMEAIGNAKTTRNDNSSRFGKFIELHFNIQYHILGASMRTYLLEKSRVVFQAPDERNYHIFYQLCAARNQLTYLHLKEAAYFHYLNQGHSPDIEGVSDLESFEDTVNALLLLGFTEIQQNWIFRIVAAVLHLGNVEFRETVISTENEQDQEGCGIPDLNKSLEIASELLEVDNNELSEWLCTKKIVSMHDIILKPMTIEQATMARDALSKHIYAELFNWIVLVINKALETHKQRHKFIGILDIYGFETFEINSFEQFCINYANEKLQQQFNLHVFKLEQEEYIKEEIQWTMIDFYDNQPCIDLIETKLGILSLLDEECKMPKGSDGSWTEKMYLKCIQYKHFAKARFGTTAFVIDHFADKVQYESHGFLEKNRDTVIDEQINVLKRSNNDFIRRLFSHDTDKLAPPGTKIKVVSSKPSYAGHTMHKKTVGSQFRDSLNLLMTTLNATTPHYVRCIKPNDTKTAFDYNPQRAVQQLRACGVLETVRISAAGFPSRWAYIEFFYRYRVLCKFNDINRNNMRLTCEKILKQYLKASDMYQFGKTKIFFRAGQVAYLEKLRSDKLRQCCIVIQSTIRAYICRKRYLKIKKSVYNIQRYGRGLLARRLADKIRRNRAAITIQRYMKGWLRQTQYKKLCKLILSFQSRVRGYLARLTYMKMKYNAKAIIIQRHIRGWLARKQYREHLHYIIICQSAIRRFLARRLFKKLRIEAKSIEHVKKLNNGLENKIISLQRKIEEMNKTTHELKNYQYEVIDLRNKLTTFKALEMEVKNLSNLLIEKDNSLNKLELDIRLEKEEKMDLIHEQEKYHKEAEMQRQLWTSEAAKLRKEIENMNEIVLANEKGAEETLRTRLAEEKTIINSEHDQDRIAYQKLLQEYNYLEMHCSTLEKQISSQGRNAHSRNISDASSISTFDESLVSTIEIPEDHGYGSVRSNTSSATTRSKLDNINWNEGAAEESDTETKHQPEYKPQVGLILQLQHKLADTEREKARIQKRLDEIEQSPKSEKAENARQDAIRIAQLEMTNSKFKAQLLQLSTSTEEGSGKNHLTVQLQNLLVELDRRNEEIIQLKGILATQSDNMRSIIKCSSKTGEYINEDGELALAYETQKTINKQLELELQDEQAKYRLYEKELKLEIDKLHEDNERQQRLLSSNLSALPELQSEEFVQDEIRRLATENLDLHYKNDALNENIRKLKKQLKAYSKTLKDSGLALDGNAKNEDAKNAVPHNRRSSVRKKEKEFQGMFSFKHGEANTIMKHLVIELKPRTAVKLLPGLPALIVFMCIRHTDYISDEEKVRCLLAAYINSVKKMVKKKHEDFETTILWFSNTIKLLNIMKQYSGEPTFQVRNTPKQNEQSLRNFDLTDYRHELSDMALWIYQATIKLIQEKVQPLIVPAILEHEEIPGRGNQMVGFRGRSSSIRDAESPGVKQRPITAILQELSNHYKMLDFYGVDFDIISQIFRQVFYFICASSMNNLLLRREWCHWSKGVQIKHNLSHLENWTRDKQLDEELIQSTLLPIIQVTYLLQANKTDKFVDSVCDMCSALTPTQICKILNLFTPVEGEERVSPTFIKKLENKLQKRPNYKEQQTLMMDTKHTFPLRISFHPSDICLESIEIPELLQLPMLEKV